MKKAVMISINPEWCELIATGKKTIEVRKTKPNIPTPFKVYIYCTKDKHLVLLKNQYGLKLCYAMNLSTAIAVGGTKVNGKVIGEYVCDYITTDFLISDTCVSV